MTKTNPEDAKANIQKSALEAVASENALVGEDGSLSSSEIQVKRASAKPPKGARIMSGMRSTAALHIGNYFGALKNWLEMQDEYPGGFYGVMDWHGMTTSYKKPADVQHWVRDIYAEWVAWGLDPVKNTIFIQSQVPELIDLFMFFMMETPMGWLERVPTWKDAIEEAKESDTYNLGRFAYPVLQAADIAIFQGQYVPIGQDQIPHLELSREIIRRFNHLYKAEIPEPKPIFTETPVLLGSDGRKMSKSYGNVFNLTQTEDELKNNIRLMPTDPARVRRTDPGEPTKCPIYSYHKLFSKPEDLPWVEEGCRSAGIGCGDCKKKLIENINGLMAEPREKKKELLQQKDTLDSIIAEGCQRARKEAGSTLEKVKDWTGFRLG